ncbi:Tudor-knot domain-containing protein [Rhizoctonia solani AG-1 IA]|uniref:Tudor-knot domain-containing protein n=1 Tax=Thanatephorus cucumeris (strain AG1-IA) TaxID=983506 RepID=L8WTQ9_THACA|nr:Tudor-knot domain-containing protein [Rhizoctonia solani AG-1 IA]
MTKARYPTNTSPTGDQRIVLFCSSVALRATIIQQRGSEYYVHYEGHDKRLDEWVPTSSVRLDGDSTSQTHEIDLDNQAGSRAKKRNRVLLLNKTMGPSLAPSDGTPAPVPDDEVNSPATLSSALAPSLRTRDQTEAAHMLRPVVNQDMVLLAVSEFRR